MDDIFNIILSFLALLNVPHLSATKVLRTTDSSGRQDINFQLSTVLKFNTTDISATAITYDGVSHITSQTQENTNYPILLTGVPTTPFRDR